ncbi:n-acylsphingosine amidohydrolase protein [Purpureocillium lilacinum]|nr:n-acylsphingosine amidohydrolase protein [Purpureocillium lilacinum]OAQ85176.1 n-acylsphingosine amidohydrolase protein [Purpureocillium lilacinum]GJN86266.1 hypothetical protein PLIIFM63780_009845 [Purpureocillium lilacinum]
MASGRSAAAQAFAEDRIPTYRIDLSLPPRERYVELATDFAPRMRRITPLFDTVLASFIPWSFLRSIVRFSASLRLRRVHSHEETQELKGIAKASGVDMYFLVAFNLLLDALLGCTSGGVLTRPEGDKGSERSRQAGRRSLRRMNRMMHFRTLDWGMPELRDILVVLEFVRSASPEPEKVIMRTVSYAGFVGTLTGVRKNLSVSLNFRANHHCSTLSLRIHQALVLLGIRPSVSSILRHGLLHAEEGDAEIDNMANTIRRARATPCYVILCSGRKTVVLQKDLYDAEYRSADDFIVHTNHDFPPTDPSDGASIQNQTNFILGMEGALEESEERQDCMQKKWTALVRRRGRNAKREEGQEPVAVDEQTLRWWVQSYPIMNECTHFGCILDPGTGTIRWLERGVDDLDIENWE